jgi:uncharacterized protein (UPF0264 family)
MPGLIVSVRNAEEALLALEGGASLIDVKEPSRGSLGRADEAVIEAVLEAVGGRVPVSAAMGELVDSPGVPACLSRLAFVKWGLAGLLAGWQEPLSEARSQARGCEVVPCAYADWRRLVAVPSPEAVCRFACENRFAALLIDTAVKDGQTLLDNLSRAELGRIAARCREGGVALALAGSLGLEALGEVAELADWVAVRGAVCDGGREGRLVLERVREAARAVTRASGP